MNLDTSESISYKDVIKILSKLIFIFSFIILLTILLVSVLYLLDTYVFNGEITKYISKINVNIINISLYIFENLHLLLAGLIIIPFIIIILAIAASGVIRIIFGVSSIFLKK